MKHASTPLKISFFGQQGNNALLKGIQCCDSEIQGVVDNAA